MRERSREKTKIDRELDQLRHCLRVSIFKSDMTHMQVAERSGLNAGVLSVTLRGDRQIRFSELLAILDALGTAPRDFFQQLYGYPRRRSEDPSDK